MIDPLMSDFQRQEKLRTDTILTWVNKAIQELDIGRDNIHHRQIMSDTFESTGFSRDALYASTDQRILRRLLEAQLAVSEALKFWKSGVR